MNAREYLFSLERHGIKLGLENITHLLEAANRPERAYPVIHVAGTNGKGSVVAMLDAILRAAGLRTGRFTSPHLIHLNERVLIDRQPIDDPELDDHLAFFQAIADRMPFPPTFFEVITAAAFRAFAQRNVDVALIEVGMGGRFDSTNVITPLVSTVTNIALEHTRYLGDTLEEIAFEKAGILKEGIPAVVSEIQPGPRDVILARASDLHCPVRLRERDFSHSVSGLPFALKFNYKSPGLQMHNVPLGLSGTYQGENAATAVATAELLRPHFPTLTDEVIAQGLAESRWPCRMERVLDNPPVILDVAHNPAGAEKLAREIDRAVVVFAASSDKDVAAMLRILSPIAKRLILTQFEGPRALPLDRLREAAAPLPHDHTPSMSNAIAQGIRLASPNLPLLITGSIFAAGEARQILITQHNAPPLAF